MEYFDLHCDTLYETILQDCSLYDNNLQLSIRRGLRYEPWVQCFAIWIPDQCRERKALALFNRAVHKLRAELAACAQVRQCISGEEIKETIAQGKAAALLTVEGGGVLGGDLSTLDHLAQCGVKMLTLTWNGSCEIGDGAMVEHPHGLTEFGKQAIHKMEELGIVADVSHASDPLFYDVAEIAKKPLVASHSNSRKLCPHPRNLTDDQFAVIQKSGGLVGLNFYPSFLEESGEAGVASVLRHADHFLSLGGERVLSIGSDFDGADMAQGIEGIQSMERLYESFLHHGYKESVVKGIFFENAYKFFTTL
ncbi:MAG: hypothetical protein HFE39_08320 [Clostridiales bacterium]|jgi:membrane dipeptidase|nr:hypothetical protein [Clostridiales bacterium]